jgi:hypothetical protein
VHRTCRITTDLTTKSTLLTRAQEWLKLAYAGKAAALERQLDRFNSEQFSARAGTDGPAPAHATAAAKENREPS